MRSADVVAAARGWLGVPYRHQGRSREGVDCIGLVLVVLAQGRALPPGFRDAFAYSRLPQAGMLEREVGARCQRIAAPVPGSIGLFRWKREAQHVAIMTGDGLVHAYESVGEVVEHGYRGNWPRRAVSFWLLPGVLYV